MSDIPEEITELATEIYAAMRDGESEEATAKLSRALLSAEARGMERERERSANLVLNWQSQLVKGELIDWHADRIAAAIRNGTEA